MTNISSGNRESNREISGAITITIDAEPNTLELVQLTSPDIFADLEARLQNASQVLVEPISNLLSQPEDFVGIFLELIASKQNVAFRATTESRDCDNLLEAMLQVPIPSASFGAHFATITEWAASLLPAALDANSAEQIARAMNDARIRPLPRNQITGRIRQRRQPTQQNDRITPQRAAELVIHSIQEEAFTNDDTRLALPCIWFFNQEFQTWRDGRWHREERFDLRVTKILQRRIPNHDLNSAFISSTLKNLQALVFLSTDIPQPCRIERPDSSPTAVKTISVDNGMFDLGQDVSTLVDTDPRVFGAPQIPVAYAPSALCPEWLRVLNEIFPVTGDDDNRISFLQEFFGYCLTPWDCSQEIFTVFVGNGANGKSVVLEVLGRMLGSKNVSNLNLEHLTGEFRLANVDGKLCNISSDMQRMPRVQEGLLKQLVSGEAVQINIKHKSPRSMKSTAKLIFATNHLPPFSDTSDGIWRRMRVVPFLETIPEANRDRNLARRLADSELPGIFNWAMEGLQRLKLQSTFSSCGVSQRASTTHRQDSDPLAQFIDECCQLGGSLRVLTNQFYKAYEGFVTASGRKPLGKSTVGKRLVNLHIRKERDTAAGRRPYFYSGISLLPGVLARASSNEQAYSPPASYEVNASPRTQMPAPPTSQDENMS